MKSGTEKRQPKVTFEICILAGGLSSRMGRDKARMRLGQRTLLGHIRATAKNVNPSLRIIRKDIVTRCGPLGGIYTALTRTRAETILFLACDMPFISVELLQKIINRSLKGKSALFTKTERAGFPFVLPREALGIVEKQIASNRFSLQSLAVELKGKVYHPTAAEAKLLFNVNTPADWKRAREIYTENPKFRQA